MWHKLHCAELCTNMLRNFQLIRKIVKSSKETKLSVTSSNASQCKCFRIKLKESRKKQSKKTNLDAIRKELFDDRWKNNVRNTHNVIQSMIKQTEKVFPWLTRNVINKSFKKHCMNMNYNLTISAHKTKQMEANFPETERTTVDNILTCSSILITRLHLPASIYIYLNLIHSH